MTLIHIDRHPPRRQLNVFGLIWLLFFAAIGGIVLWQTGSMPSAAALWGLAAVVPAVGWAVPEAMRIVYVGMAYAALPIGLVVSYAMMLAVYYLVLTPTGLAMRLFGYDPMHRRFDSQAPSYWGKREPTDDVNRYFRQF